MWSGRGLHERTQSDTAQSTPRPTAETRDDSWVATLQSRCGVAGRVDWIGNALRPASVDEHEFTGIEDRPAKRCQAVLLDQLSGRRQFFCCGVPSECVLKDVDDLPIETGLGCLCLICKSPGLIQHEVIVVQSQ